MTEPKFTLGPWLRVRNPAQDGGARADTIYGENGNGPYVADVYLKYAFAPTAPDAFEANAHLIAAAPDLYAALEALKSDESACMFFLGQKHEHELLPTSRETVRSVNAALAKARGQS